MTTPRFAWTVLAAVGLLPLPVGAKDPPKDKGTIKVREEKEPYAPYKQLLPTDKVIEQYQERLKRNPKDLQACTMLAQLYIRRARETGDFAGYDRAGAAARKALALNKNDFSAQANLAVVLCAQHKFAEGLR